MKWEEKIQEIIPLVADLDYQASHMLFGLEEGMIEDAQEARKCANAIEKVVRDIRAALK